MMVNNQGYLFVIFTLDGVLIGIIFDFFRILRKSFKTKNFVTNIEDICFWIAAGIIFLYSMCKFADGEIRFFMILGVLLGVTLYILTISKYVIKVSVFVIDLLKKILIFPMKLVYNFIKKVIFRPISFICIKIRNKVVKIFKKIEKKRGFFVKKEKYIIEK